MRSGWRLAVVMPAYNEEANIEQAIGSVPEYTDLLVVVDDGSTDATNGIANSAISARGLVIKTERIGVGGAIAKGYSEVRKYVESQEAIEEKWAIVVMAGDGQMDPSDIDALLEPLSRVPFVKGDRWAHHEGLGKMPRNRKIGSWFLGALTSLASGRKVRDPQCGYTAVTLEALKEWDWVNKWQGYGYPKWWRLNIGSNSIPFDSVPVKSVYRNEKSGIRVFKFLPKISLLLLSGLWRRGWNWYVKGSGNTPLPSRLVVSSTWFTSLLVLLTLPFLVWMENLSIVMLPAVAGLMLVTWKLDQDEVQRRMIN